MTIIRGRLLVAFISMLFSTTSLVKMVEADACPNSVVSEDVACNEYSLHRGRLRLDGIQLVDQHGEKVQLRGISSHALQYYPKCVSKSSIQFYVETWGINVFRAVVGIEASEGGYEANPSFFDKKIASIVKWCKELGIYVIIDWHVLLEGDPNTYLDTYGGSSGLAVNFWTKQANLYKHETHVLYEIANEPNGVSWTSVLAYHNSIISIIRDFDPEAIIIAGTSKWSQEIDLAYWSPVDQTYNVMYAFHFYAASHSNLLSVVQNYIHILPIFVSAWGISDTSGSGDADTSTAEEFLDLFSGVNDPIPPVPVVSWVQWSLSDKDATDSILEPNSCSRSAWESTRCPSRYTENYLRSRLYGDSMLDCDRAPSLSPTISSFPSAAPSSVPSFLPSCLPTSLPSVVPTSTPSSSPSVSFSPTLEAASSGKDVATEDIIGPGGSYLIGLFVIFCIVLFAVIYFKKYSAIPQKEGNFKLTSPTFVSVKSNRYRANQRNGDGTDTNVHDREIDMTNIYDNCDVNSITVSEENMSLAIENGRTTPTCGRYSPANTASRSPSPPRVQSNNALNTNLKSPVAQIVARPPVLVEHQTSSRTRFAEKKPKRNTRTVKKS